MENYVVMIDPERIQRLAAKLVDRKDALEMVHQMRCGGKKFDEGGDKDAAYIYKPKNAEIPAEVIPLGSPYSLAKYRVYDDGTIYIPGLSRVDQDIKDGAYWMYGPIASKKTYLRNKDNGEYFEYDPDINPSLNLSGYDKVGYDEIKPMLPRRDYIGGDNYRLNTVKRVPGLLDMIKRKADSYGLDPNLLLHRFMKEGIVDYWVNRYNTENAVDQNDSFFKNLLNEEVDGFNGLGLDDAGSNLIAGKYTLKDPSATWQERTARNEEGRDVVSVVSPDMNSALEIKAAEMAYRQRELAKRGLTGNAYVNAAYNMGLYHDKLNDPDYVSRNYTVPDYHVFDGGGKFFRTNLQNESPMMYEPMKPWMPDVSVPMRFVPEPDLGDYVPPSSTGLAESYPITVSVPSVRPDIGFVEPEIAEDAVDLFSDEAKARRRLKQAYTESRFKKNAESEAGARGLFQIMPITEQDYLGRGRGKKGDIWNEGYNGGIRDWVMGIIPRDLQEFWSDDDSDINKLAKLYAAYNWGAGNLRKFFQSRLDAGLSNDDPYEWVEAIQNKGKRKDETKNYVKFLALDQDIPDSYMTNEKFEDAARSRGYMAEGGRLFEDGGPENGGFLKRLMGVGTTQPAMPGVATSAMSFNRDIPRVDSTVGDDLSYAGALLSAPQMLAAIPERGAYGIMQSAIENKNIDPTLTTKALGKLAKQLRRKNEIDKAKRMLPTIMAMYRGVPDAVGDTASWILDALDVDYSKGGKIRIKPENRGKFTALKKRTGHSASWFKAHGTPAQKKMAVFALNAKKWNHKHGEGGFMNKYDGETEPTGQMDRVPNWVVRGQDYSEWNPGDIQEIINWGYTDPEAFFGQEGQATRDALSRAGMADSVIGDIYRNAPEELQARLGDRYKGAAQKQEEYNQGIRDYANGIAPYIGAMMSWPLAAEAIPAYASLAPAEAMALGHFAMPMASMAAGDEFIRRKTPFNGYRDMVMRSPMFEDGKSLDDILGAFPGADDPYGARDWAGSAVEIANPVFFLPYGEMAKGINSAIDRYAASGNKIGVVPQSTQEAMQMKLDAARQVDDALRGSTQSADGQPVLRSAMRSSQNMEDTQAILRDIARTNGVSMNPTTSSEGRIRGLSDRELVDFADNFDTMQMYDPANYTDEMSRVVDNELARRGFTVEAPGSRAPIAEPAVDDYSSMSIDELRHFVNNRRYGDPRGAEARRALRERMRQTYGLSRNTDVTRMSNDQLVRLYNNYDLYDVNSGLLSTDADYIDYRPIRDAARAELDARVNNFRAPSTYTSIDDAVSDYRLLRARHVSGQRMGEFERAAADVVNPMVYRGEAVPSELDNLAEKLAIAQFDRGQIGRDNPYVKKIYDGLKEKMKGEKTQRLFRDYYESYVTGAEDNSSNALSKLKSKYPGKSYKDLTQIIKNVDSLPENERDEVLKIINSAYKAPEISDRSRFSAYRRLKDEAILDELENRLGDKGFTRSMADVLADPSHPDYLVAADIARNNGAYILPGDIQHMYWFQVKNALNSTSGMPKSVVDEAVRNAEWQTGAQSSMLERAMPRKTAIAEQNTSPQSYKVKISGALRSPGGYGTGPGQTMLMEIPSSVGDVSGNTAQTTKVVFDANGNMFNMNPHATSTELGELSPYYFTKDEFEKIYSQIDVRRLWSADSREQLKQLLQNSKEARSVVDRLIMLSRKLNSLDVNGTTAAIGRANRIHSEIGLPQLTPPTQDMFAYTSKSKSFYDDENINDIATLLRRAYEGMVNSNEGYATTMHRTPMITLKNKYGGLINRIGSVYGKDADSIGRMFSNIRSKRMK